MTVSFPHAKFSLSNGHVLPCGVLHSKLQIIPFHLWEP